MTPEQQQIKQLTERIERLERVENVAFIESMTRRLTDSFSIPSKLSDLTDVEDTDGASTGEVLKKTATTWQPGTDIDT